MGRKEIADQVLLQIRTIVDVFHNNFGRRPNQLTLGVKLWDCLRSYFEYMVVYSKNTCKPEAELMGIPVTIDYERPYIIAPGIACNYTIPEPGEEEERPKFLVQTLWKAEELYEE